MCNGLINLIMNFNEQVCFISDASSYYQGIRKFENKTQRLTSRTQDLCR